ncbi:hypothetical protein [Nocardioides ferulae]|uniref:hypothetical protein n=1 Tax=Nocardioides ferulae TaxID=2340821 RepID=UPI000F87CA96|nr:hypothetical protein [Nocardioides ferulae]
MRHRGQLDGGIHFASTPQLRQDNPRVLFQSIIHDGLIGREHLDRFRYTVDVQREQLLLTPFAGS